MRDQTHRTHGATRHALDDNEAEPTMATYVMLTRLTPETLKSPGEVSDSSERSPTIRRECAQVKWVGNYALLDPYDYLDLFEAPDEMIAAKVATIVRSYGHVYTETWTAMPWERFELVIPG
jgi:uncharacterized protein with GYD domain